MISFLRIYFKGKKTLEMHKKMLTTYIIAKTQKHSACLIKRLFTQLQNIYIKNIAVHVPKE